MAPATPQTRQPVSKTGTRVVPLSPEAAAVLAGIPRSGTGATAVTVPPATAVVVIGEVADFETTVAEVAKPWPPV